MRELCGNDDENSVQSACDAAFSRRFFNFLPLKDITSIRL